MKYVLKRILIMIPVFFGMTALVFFLSNLTPGSPVDAMITPEMGAEDIAALEHRMGLDQPVYVQYFKWLQRMFQGALGHCELTENLRGVRYTKLTDNSCFSGLATALGCLVGDILDNRKAMECIAYTGMEAAKVIQALGVTPVELFGLCPTPENVCFQDQAGLDRVIDYWTRIYTPYRGQKASMIQDLEKGRVCEILQINGKFVSDGEKVGVPTPFNRKIVELVLEIQDGKMSLSDAWSNLDRFQIPAL